MFEPVLYQVAYKNPTSAVLSYLPLTQEQKASEMRKLAWKLSMTA